MATAPLPQSQPGGRLAAPHTVTCALSHLHVSTHQYRHPCPQRLGRWVPFSLYLNTHDLDLPPRPHPRPSVPQNHPPNSPLPARTAPQPPASTSASPAPLEPARPPTRPPNPRASHQLLETPTSCTTKKEDKCRQRNWDTQPCKTHPDFSNVRKREACPRTDETWRGAAPQLFWKETVLSFLYAGLFHLAGNLGTSRWTDGWTGGWTHTCQMFVNPETENQIIRNKVWGKDLEPPAPLRSSERV